LTTGSINNNYLIVIIFIK